MPSARPALFPREELQDQAGALDLSGLSSGFGAGVTAAGGYAALFTVLVDENACGDM